MLTRLITTIVVNVTHSLISSSLSSHFFFIIYQWLSKACHSLRHSLPYYHSSRQETTNGYPQNTRIYTRTRYHFPLLRHQSCQSYVPYEIGPANPFRSSYTNASTGVPIDYYEIEIKPFTQQVYPGKKAAALIGYDGISPGPTFMMEKGREAVVRFINKSVRKSSIHLHGSYSRAPFDGWAEDTTAPGEYKDYYYPNSQSGRTLWYHVSILNTRSVVAHLTVFRTMLSTSRPKTRTSDRQASMSCTTRTRTSWGCQKASTMCLLHCLRSNTTQMALCSILLSRL